MRLLAKGLVILAALFSVVLLAGDVNIGTVPARWADLISALPLLAVGLSFVVMQWIIRPQRTELFRNLLLAATFILWGAVQLMTKNVLAKKLGDLVIALYVVDLAWPIVAKLNSENKPANYD